jgi:hypothetical protein
VQSNGERDVRYKPPSHTTEQKENKAMKTKIIKSSLIACGAFALALNAMAADETTSMKPMKGGEHLLMLQRVETKAQADALKPADTIAMVCAKCKTVYVTRVKQGVKGAELLMAKGQPKELIGTHACAGCNSTLTIVGVQKGAHLELKHTCGTCGDDSAFCCATKPGSATTKGMEKEKK